MTDKFIESIRVGFINQITEIINETKERAKRHDLDAIDTLILINNDIGSWISSINSTINVDDELLSKVADLKRPFVTEAKQEVAKNVSKIIEHETFDITVVTSKIDEYMKTLKQKGINLDEINKKEQKKVHLDNHQSVCKSLNIESDKIDDEKSHILKKEPQSYRRSSSCSTNTCGGGSGCC